MTKLIAIYIYPQVEVLDFAGPFEVFNTASRMHQRLTPGASALFEVRLIGETASLVPARYGFVVQPHAGLAGCPQPDVLVIPGGIHTHEMEKPQVIQWIARMAQQAEITASVCTGAFLLAQAGLLAGQAVTTHWEDIPDLRQMFPKLDVRENTPWVDNGRVVCSAGISAGIEMSLHLVAKLAGHELALRTARQMEYEWRYAELSKEME